jgi:hypothetical protein
LQACVILENGMFTIVLIWKEILLKVIQFRQHIGYQILPNNLPLENTVSILTAFAFADDAKLDRNSLLRVKKKLEDFGALSGLECNVEKLRLCA